MVRRRLLVFCLALLTAWASLPVTTASAAVGDLSLVSRAASGKKGNGESRYASVSANGKKVAFESEATNLHPKDKVADPDVYVKSADGKIQLASSTAAGIKGDGSSEGASISGDGTKVAFKSTSRNLSPLDNDSWWDIYVKDLTTGKVVLASVNAAGVKGNFSSDAPSLSADGTRVAFVTSSSNLHPGDTSSDADVYVKDLVTGELWLASSTKGGVSANASAWSPSLAGNGTRVAFHTTATNLHPSDKDATSDVYVKELATGKLFLASTSASGKKGNGWSSEPSMSGTGHKVAFESQASNLHAKDKDTTADIFVKTLSSGAIAVASTQSNGKRTSGGSSHQADLSGDGNKVTFISYARLTAKNPPATADVYVKTLSSGKTALVSNTKAGKHGTMPSVAPDISADGAHVVFHTSSRDLLGADKDSGDDVYAKHISSGKRLCGGLAVTKVGTSKGETINGTSGPDVIDGLAGNDIINGKGGDDVICGGAGNDKINGGAGADTLYGQGGKDTLTGEAGRDRLYGGAANDKLKGGKGHDHLYGEAGNDELRGGAGNDWLYGQKGQDKLFGDAGRDTCNGGPDTDTASACEKTVGIP